MSQTDADRVLSALERYAETGQGDVKPLRGMNNVRRLRHGDYRVFFVVNRVEHRIEVASVRHRREAYR
ncbi:MAG: type II toxin-antitoxin system RelE/ParE family toxin [Dehalococcoidia bacterium]|nr:type II toxin-antitoxin system RelE/ParE family toxin [Dehalococcoidia bacterium]